ncbi:MAG: hypothetical protein QOH39_2590 [Verrucomicrobiota bacterium]|jgi:glycosyltransferase involved in cell wall biosynthesis
MGLPKISVCLLTYNRADVLGRSIESLLAQDFSDFELIINDDCSTDSTPSIAEQHVKVDRRVWYARNNSNLRYAGNQNAAMERASSELVAIVHDGDVYRPDCLSKWYSAMKSSPNVGLVYNASDALDENGKVVCRYRHPYPPIMRGIDMIDEMLRLYSSPIFGIIMLRKSFLSRVGEFDERFPVLGDVDMWMRLLLVSDVAYINEPLFQIHPREKSHINRSVNWKIIEEHYQIFRNNAVRRFSEDPEAAGLALHRLRRKQRMKVARAAFRCLRHAQIRMTLEGFSYLTKL